MAMNKERMLDLLCAAYNKCEGYVDPWELKEAIEMMEKDILEDGIKAKPGGASIVSRRNAALKMITGLNRPSLEGTWLTDGKMTLCDGYIGIILNEPLPEMPEVEGCDFGRVLKGAENTVAEDGIKLPSVKELRSRKSVLKHNPEHRAGKSGVASFFELGDGTEWWFDIDLMIRLLSILGGKDNEIFLPKPGPRAKLGPAIVRGENGVGLILPINKK